MALEHDEAKKIAASYLRIEDNDNSEVVIEDIYTIERLNCFVFFYQSRKYLETGQFEDQLAGNGPVLVDKRTGAIRQFGTAYPTEKYLADFEAEAG